MEDQKSPRAYLAGSFLKKDEPIAFFGIHGIMKIDEDVKRRGVFND